MDFKTDDDDMWSWQCQEYDLGDDTALDISKTLLNDGPTDDFACVFDAGTTPARACGDIVYHVNNRENIKDLSNCKDVSLQMKRRRMLCFECEDPGATLGIEDIPSSFDNESPNSMNEGVSEMSQWVSGFSDGKSTSVDFMDQSNDWWISDYLNDPETQMCYENINPSDAPDVYIDIADICNELPENDMVKGPPPVHTSGNVSFKGRKSYMQNPAKLPSSVAYPFAFLKPCGVQGEMTLKDINKLIRDPASKLKQKREDDTLADYPTSAISGKPVVGKTKIHTVGGKGSITILRTKG